MAAGYMLNRGVLTFRLHCQLVSRNPSLIQVREKKRWMKAYTHIMAKKLKLEGPPPPKPRYLTFS